MGIPVSEIVASLKERNCTILLGPGLALDKKGGLLQPGVIDYFKGKQLEIDEDMDNLYSCKPAVKTRAYGYLKEYYRDNGEPNHLHRQLARIPCHLYISINPDLFMKQALEDLGTEHEFKYYIKSQPPEEVANPTVEKPLLYNLFGSIDNQQSLIFTHDDLIRYLFSIIQEFKLPRNLRRTVEDCHYFIFMGFDFDKWYLRLLLKLFLVDETKLSIASEAGSGTQVKLRTYYTGNYGLEFVEHNIEEYIKSLCDECHKQGLLRSTKEKARIPIQEEIKELIKTDMLEEALKRLYQFVEKTSEQVFKDKAEDKQDLLNELDSHISQFRRSEKTLRKGLISEEADGIEKNKIREAVLTITSKLVG